jgi:hypothetical protein
VAVAVERGGVVAVARGGVVDVAVARGREVAVARGGVVAVARGGVVAVGAGVPACRVQSAGTFAGSQPTCDVCACRHLYVGPWYVTSAFTA